MKFQQENNPTDSTNAGPRLKCGTQLWTTRHSGPYVKRQVFSDTSSEENVLSILSDGTYLIRCYPFIKFTRNVKHEYDIEYKDGKEIRKRIDIMPFVKEWLDLVGFPHNAMMEGSAPSDTALVLLAQNLYIDMRFLHELLRCRYECGPLNDVSEHLANYLFTNLQSWSKLMKLSQGERDSFFEQRYGETINLFSGWINDLSKWISRKTDIKKQMDKIDARQRADRVTGPYLSVGEAAAIMEVSVSTITLWFRKKHITRHYPEEGPHRSHVSRVEMDWIMEKAKSYGFKNPSEYIRSGIYKKYSSVAGEDPREGK